MRLLVAVMLDNLAIMVIGEIIEVTRVARFKGDVLMA
jgi:hypothetical protein